MESRDLSNLEVQMGLGMMSILKKRQQQKCAFERALKAAELAPARNENFPIVRDISVLLLDDDGDADLGPNIVKGRRFLRATADFEAGFNVAGAAQKKVIGDPEGQVNKVVPDTQNLDLVVDVG